MVDNEKINFFREFFSFKTNKAEGVIGFHRALGIGSWDMFNGGTGGLIGSWLLYFMTSFGGVNPGISWTFNFSSTRYRYVLGSCRCCYFR